MSGLVTLADLVARSRQRADLVSNENIASAEADSYVNQSLAELYDIIVQADEDYFTVTTNMPVTANVATVDISGWTPKLLKLRGIDIPWNGQTYKLTAQRMELGERNDLQGPMPSYLIGMPTSFFMYSSTIKLAPTPSSSFTATVWYIPVPPTLSGAATFNAQSGWDEFIVVDAARKMLLKQERDVTALTGEREQLRSHIISSYRRDFSGPKRVTRTRYRTQFPYFRW